MCACVHVCCVCVCVRVCVCVCVCARVCVYLIDHPVGTKTGGGGESSVEHTLKDLPENATVDQF